MSDLNNGKKVKVVNIEAGSLEEAKEKVKKYFEGLEGVRTPYGISGHNANKSRGGRKVVKTVPATAEEIKKSKELSKRYEALKAEQKALDASKERWWAEIRLRLPDGFSTNSLSYNDVTNEIEYLSDDGDDIINL